MTNLLNKSLRQEPLRRFTKRAISLAGIVCLCAAALQPLAALADTGTTTRVTLTDANNGQNPAQQQVVGGSPDASTTPLTQVTYQVTTSTPDTIPLLDLNATSTILSNSTTTPDSSSTTTPDTASTTPLLDPGTASTTIDATTTLDLLNSNTINATTTATTTANSGLNDTVTNNGDINNATTTTGDVNVYANVLTVSNINLLNSQIVQMNENFNKLAADLYLNQPELTAGQRTQDLISPICSNPGVSCQSITSFKLTNQNTADINNNITASGNSGGNTIAASGDNNHSTITTGNVNAVVNVLNIVNANAINSTWTIVTFNVFGDWTGDLVMPSELYFTDSMSVGSNAASDISQVQKVVLDISNNNTSNITNNVTVQTDTGSNVVATVPNASSTVAGDVNNSNITSGISTADSTVRNVSNITVYNSSWFLGLINFMGQWTGNIYSLPSTVNVNYQPNGFTFVSASDPSAAIPAELLAQLTPPDATTTTATDTSALQPTGTSTSDSTVNMQMNNSNQANINNNVTVDATTGQNAVTAGGDVNHASITTGNATALANILNFANANLVNSSLYVGLINIFGNWKGNILFGYPDLSVNQAIQQDQVAAPVGSPVNINVTYANKGNGSVDGTQLEWKFDPSIFDPNSVQSSGQFQTLAPGDLMFNLGKLEPNQNGTMTLQLQTILTQSGGVQNQFFAHIFGNGPELNYDNNQNIATVNAAQPPSSGGGGGGGGGGGWSGGGNSLNTKNKKYTGPIGVYPNFLNIYKDNSATGQMQGGQKIDFTITVDNDGNNTLHSLVVYDTMTGPDGSTVSSEAYPISDMSARQETYVRYSLVLDSSVKPGTYTNSAYVQGLNDSLQTVRSQQTALSTFTVSGNGTGFGGLQMNELLDSITNASTSDPSFASVAGFLGSNGQILGVSCVQPTFTKNLKVGSNSADVKTLEIYLNNHGYVIAKRGTGSPGKESNYFSSLLKTALTRFQKAKGIKERGTFGNETRAVLNALLAPADMPFCTQQAQSQQLKQQFQFISTLRLGSSGNEVLKLQQWLNSHGFTVASKGAGSPGKESNYFGQLTKAALISLQRKVNILNENGITAANTRKYLNLN